MSSRDSHGKKVGNLTVILDKHPTVFRGSKARVDIELRFEVHTGLFHAEHGGIWYADKTRDGIRDQLKVVLDVQVDVEWHRYIVLDYSAKIREDAVRHGRGYGCEVWSIDRSKPVPSDHEVIGLELTWSIVEYSTPFPDPGDGHAKRMQRSLDSGGDPRDTSTNDNDEIPEGAFRWTEEREAKLREILCAFREIDRNLVALFGGAPDELAAKLDGFSVARLGDAPERKALPSGASKARKASR